MSGRRATRAFGRRGAGETGGWTEGAEASLSRGGGFRAWPVAPVASFVLWLGFVATLDSLELGAGAIAAALAATLAVAVRARGLPQPSSGRDVLRRAGGPLARIPLDFALLVGRHLRSW